MALEEIYTELIAEESRNPAHRRHLEAPTVVLKGHNPSCGDEITLELCVENDTIVDASFTGMGCAISQASTSLMIDLVKGQPVARAEHLIGLFLGMIKGEIEDGSALEELEDAAALKGIARLPARVKCAVLSWHTLAGALRGKENKA